MRSCTRLSRFSACNIEKLRVAWGRGYTVYTHEDFTQKFTLFFTHDYYNNNIIVYSHTYTGTHLHRCSLLTLAWVPVTLLGCQHWLMPAWQRLQQGYNRSVNIQVNVYMYMYNIRFTTVLSSVSPIPTKGKPPQCVYYTYMYMYAYICITVCLV